MIIVTRCSEKVQRQSEYICKFIPSIVDCIWRLGTCQPAHSFHAGKKVKQNNASFKNFFWKSEIDNDSARNDTPTNFGFFCASVFCELSILSSFQLASRYVSTIIGTVCAMVSLKLSDTHIRFLLLKHHKGP